MTPTRAVLLVVAPLFAVPAIAADDYPYSGFFTGQETGLADADAQLSCAYSFFRQARDGSFIGHHVDLKRFHADGTLRYLEHARGRCVLDPTGKVETCTILASADPGDIGVDYFDVITARTDDAIDTAIFETEAEAATFAASGMGQPTSEIRLSRCAGFDDAKLGSFLTNEMSPYSVDQRGDILAPMMDDDQTRQTMSAIHKKISGNK